MTYFTKGGENNIQQANKYLILKNYYEPMLGFYMFSEQIYNESKNLRTEVNNFLKNAVVFKQDGTVDSDRVWALELFKGYDESGEQQEWQYCIRDIEMYM